MSASRAVTAGFGFGFGGGKGSTRGGGGVTSCHDHATHSPLPARPGKTVMLSGVAFQTPTVATWHDELRKKFGKWGNVINIRAFIGACTTTILLC